MTTSGAGRLKEKAVVTLVDAGAEALDLRRGETWLGHITGRRTILASQ
jgi:hypothetical protein